MISGNKGEWSEFYVLIKLLAEGKLYASDENAEIDRDLFFPVLSVVRNETDSKNVVYDIPDVTDTHIVVYLNENIVGYIDRKDLSNEAIVLYDKIKEGGDRAFAIPVMESIMNKLLCNKLAAPATDKTDITVEVHDTLTGYDRFVGFSIKSELGNAPSLLNASKATNFIFEVDGISDEEMVEINAIDGREKIKSRFERVLSLGNVHYKAMSNQVFSNNLILLDTVMERLIAEALFIYFRDNDNNCKSVVTKLEEENPFSIHRKGFYEYKFKKFLCSVALGMVPSRVWDGKDEANGGYIIVNKKGDVIAFHIYNRDDFETYLLNNTKFEHASTSRHDYASIYKIGDQKLMNLNLQIRFK